MSSKAIKPKIRLGQSAAGKRRAIVLWTLAALVTGGGAYAAWRYTGQTEVDVPVAKVRRGEFVISVKTRGEIKSARSVILTAPQVPDIRIVTLAEAGKPIKKGDVVVAFDAAQQEQRLLERSTGVRTIDSELVQTKAGHRIMREMDGMNLMTSEYNLERAKLEAGKAEVVSQIEGEKSRIDVGISEGELKQVKATANAHGVTQDTDLRRFDLRKKKAERDLDRTRTYLSQMVIRAPNDGVVSILPNYRAQGGSSPPFKEGDRAWTGAAIAEIPDLSEMRIELKLDEVDRGKLSVGQRIRVKVDAIPDKEFTAQLGWISPIASLNFRGFGPPEKIFPAWATLEALDSRLRPGMSATAEVVIESAPNVLMIPVKASVSKNSKPAVWVQRGQDFELRRIEVGKRNDSDTVVVKGLKEGDQVALENPEEALRRAKKL